MKMIGHDHFICHSYCHFWVSGFSWLVSFLLSVSPSQSEHEEFQISPPS